MVEEKNIMENKDYYIQNGYVGNTMLFWRKNGDGYTTNLDEAGIWDEESAKTICANRNKNNRAWPISYIDKIASLQVDTQRADGKNILKIDYPDE